MLYEEICELNKKNKLNFNEVIKDTDRRTKNLCKKQFVCTLYNSGSDTYLRRNGNNLKVISQYTIIKFLINHSKCYIKNISLLSNSKCMNYFELDDYYFNQIKNCLNDTKTIYNSFSIKKVENLRNYLGKVILCKGHILYNINDSIVLVEKDNNVFLVSDCIIKVTVTNNFNFSFISVKKISISNLDISSLTNLNGLFLNCHSLEYVEFLSLDTSCIIEMKAMFENCHNLKDIKLSTLDTSHVKRFDRMFKRCNSLENLDLSTFNVKKSKSFSEMFAFCNSLKKIEISNWKAPDCLSISYLFYGCNSLKEVNLNSLFKSIRAKTNLDKFQWINKKQYNKLVADLRKGGFTYL